MDEKKFDKQKQREIAALIRAYHSAKIAADNMKSIGNQLKEIAKDAGVEELRGGGFIVTVKDVTSTTLDSKALKADMPELWETYGKTSTSTRICIK